MNDNQWYEKLKEEEKERRAAILATSKEKAARIGKEIFDFDTVIGYMKYAPSDEYLSEGRESLVRDYEYRYYTDDDVMTLKEYATFLDKCELEGFGFGS